MSESRTSLEHDWYGLGIPANVELDENSYLDDTYSFVLFLSKRRPGLILRRSGGAYDRTTFVVGPEGRVEVGEFSCLNSVYLICNGRISIGSHCLLSWGVVLTDTWLQGAVPLERRRRALERSARRHERSFPFASEPRAICVEDNVWVGFDSVICPGVTLGRGCIVGCKTIVREDVPAYAVYAGNPARVVRFIEPSDDEPSRQKALRKHLSRTSNRSTEVVSHANEKHDANDSL